jgi:lipopolysaccharide biosynthesis glycosyltransferase
MAHLKMPTYLRLLIPSLIDEERILYIDCDTYINEDLTSLFTINLEQKEIAVALDQYIKENEYFNAGVILWDLKNIDRKSFLDKCKKIYLEKESELMYGDQCILNYLYADKKKIIPPDWNEQVLTHTVYYPVLEYFISNRRKIIHFAGPIKPWDCEFGSAGWKFWQKYMV